MEAVLFGGAPIQDKPSMVDRVVDYAGRFYEGEVDEGELRLWCATAVDRIWGDGPRVTKYVPMLALREVREHVVEQLEARLAAGETLPAEAARDTWVWSTEHQFEHPDSASAA